MGLFNRDNWRESARAVAKDLATLQINTILKSNITGGSMPPIRFALCDIAERYAIELTRISETYEVALAVDFPASPIGGYRTFDCMQDAAVHIQTVAGEQVGRDDADFYMLSRIRANSNRIKEAFESILSEIECDAGKPDESTPHTPDEPFSLANIGLTEPMKLKQNHLTRGEIAEFERTDAGIEDLDFARRDFLAVQKIWELGTEQIVMQTAIQLDGDVFTRIQHKYSDEEYIGLHEIHQLGLDTSLKYWDRLVSTMTAFASSAFGFFRRR